MSISGVRGIANGSITPELVVQYVAAFTRLQIDTRGSEIEEGTRPEVCILINRLYFGLFSLMHVCRLFY